MYNTREKGSIYYNKARDNWTVLYYETDPKTGQKKRKSKSQPTKEMAEKFLTSLMYQRKNPLYMKKHKICLGDYMKLRTKTKLETNIISENSLGRINQTLNIIKKSYLYNKKIDEITTEEIQNYFNTLTDYSSSTINKIFSEFRQIFNYAFSQNIILANPMVDIIKPKSKIINKPLRALTLDEEENLVNYLTGITLKKCRYRNVFLIQMFTGMRIGEVLALKTTDIDLAHNLITVEHTISVDAKEKTILKETPKSFNGMREIPMPSYLKPYIMEQMKIANINNHKENLLFVNRNKGYVDHRIANKILKKMLEELDIEGISTHSLRHTFGTRCIESGVRDVALQRIMGHSSITATLNNYVDVSEELKESELEKVYSYYRENMNIDIDDFD